MQAQDTKSAVMVARKTHRSSRRNRVPLSCDPCRSRKLRCNREKPCQNCSVRDERASCKYESSKTGTSSSQPTAKQGDAMQQRIDHLEGLVKKLITQHQLNPSNEVAEIRLSGQKAMSDTSDSAGSPSKTVIDGVHSVYKGAEDWYDVLQEINELKQYWSEAQDDQVGYNVPSTLSNTVDGSSLLFGQVQRIDKIELLTTLPPKHQVDKLIHHFFDRENFPITIVPILHQPTFMREYDEHWREPSQTSIIWLGLLFSILSINMLAYSQFGEPLEYEGTSESLFQLYRLRTAQCLIMGDIAKCLPYTIEALRLNTTAELNRKDDNSRGLWMMTGLVVRAAINMGYHRDPSQSPSISPLQAEYRRRVWISVTEIEDMASFVVGFPRMVSSTYSDTKEPSNVYDWELSENMTVLPPPRPMSEITSVTYLIYKARLFRALGRITDFNNTPNLGPYEEIQEIDRTLYESHQNLPADLRMHDVKWDCTASDKKANSSTLQLGLMYHQGMCQLHRRFIAKGRLDLRYNYSRDRCISSALAILNFQNNMEPFWYRFSRPRKGFILAAMILFLELEHRRRSPDTGISTTSPDNGVILHALSVACALWDDAKFSCDEAQKTHQILTGMLSSFQTSVGSNSSPSQLETPSPLLDFPGMMGATTMQSFSDNPREEKNVNGISDEMNIDWATWDAFIEGAMFENES